MKHRIITVISLVALVLAGALYMRAWADTNGDASHSGLGRHGFEMRILKQLDLTDEQKAQVKSILSDERPTIQPLVQQLGATRRELRAATVNGQFDEATVRALAAKATQAMTDLIVEKARVQSKIYNVLTPEQQTKFNQLQERIIERMGHRHGHHGQ